MNRQDVFTKAVTHLLRQGKQSSQPRANEAAYCMYRHPDGLQCAAGPFLKDDFASKCEGRTISQLQPDVFIDGAYEHTNLLRMLQRVHDNNDPSFWREKLTNLAFMQNLEMPVVEGAVL